MRNPAAPPNSPTHVQSLPDQVLLAIAPIPREHHQPLLAGRRGRRRGLEGCRGRSLDSLSQVEQAGGPLQRLLSIRPPSTLLSRQHRLWVQRIERRQRTTGPSFNC
ncbi:unnamed protein product [Pleuronectes platessa]|uniref:Uncharacterized protein n=1 Tax=Pleuronectes platessa TaxID=8262 RepID=A0A9N7V8J8_PLEPL|nr:unnamed protein product [Pleuronectes platessa]